VSGRPSVRPTGCQALPARLQRTGQLVDVERRLFFGRGLSVGALALLAGCDITDDEGVQRVLSAISRWNDRVQAALFNPNRLAPTYPESAVVQDFRYNAYYGEDRIPRIDGQSYKLELAGLIADKRPWSLDQLYALPQESQITRHVCVEGWSMIGKWSGVPLRVFLERVGADLSAKYVGFLCADGYYGSLDMPSALHPQTILALKYADRTLPPRYGFPMKVRVPTKLGFKNPKFITAIFVTNRFPGGFWEDRGYNWFAGT
jgi:DMSO/TMAO reductase YedYZ molybdopterin-dependent catalytic subunit